MADLRALLQLALSDSKADFRPGQAEAIQAVISPPYRAIVVQATGWGKSMVYFIATKVLRDAGRGPTLVVSPLLSLMRNQREAAERLGLNAEQWTSENEKEHKTISERLNRNTIDLILVAPEQLANAEFSEVMSSTTLAKAGLVVIDEAHCISDWGHDFRPDYQRIGRFLANMPPTTSVLATTATANDRVVEDVQDQLGKDIPIQRGSLARPGLKVQVIGSLSYGQRLAWLSDHLNELPGSGIIYCLTIRDANRVTDWLQKEGHNVKAYHRMVAPKSDGGATRRELETKLQSNEVKALVATVALGMGFDKPDLGFVVHFQSPGNLVAYYQQIGRAGRAIPEALAILMLGKEDDEIIGWFIKKARPDEMDIEAVLSSLEQGPLRESAVLARVNLSQTSFREVVRCLLAMDAGPIVKNEHQYQLTPNKYQPDTARLAKLKDRRELERGRLLEFARANVCHLDLVRKELDDPASGPCGECANCLGRPLVSLDIESATLQRALQFMNRSDHPIAPRLKWQSGAFPIYGWTGNIHADLQCAEGVCLSFYGEPELGKLAAEGKPSGKFADVLVTRAVEVLKERNLGEFNGIVAVPSASASHLVVDFANRLAVELGVPAKEIVTRVRTADPQKAQRGAYWKAKNLDGLFEVQQSIDGRILLVDDMVDSRWTFTVIGALLRKNGASEVVPLALANSSGHDDDE